MGSDLLYINILRFSHHSEVFQVLWRIKCRPVKNETQTCEERNADWSVFTAYLNYSDTQKKSTSRHTRMLKDTTIIITYKSNSLNL